MNTRASTVIILVLILLATIAGIWLYDLLPEPLASHWDLRWQVDGYTSRFWGAFLMPLIAAALYLLFLVLPQIDPLKANIARFRGTYNTLILLVIGFLLYLHALTLAWNLGVQFDMGRLLTPALGLIFFFGGVLIGRSKRNWFVGIRTPWTLSNDTVWEETNHLGAILFKASGVLAFGAVLLGSYRWLVVLIPVVGSALFLIPYSLVIYRREMKSAG